MKYKKGNYKYTLAEDYCSESDLLPTWSSVRGFYAKTDFIELFQDGRVHLKKGFAWDGCSGCTWDDDTNQVPGMIHDAHYGLMRLGLLRPSCRILADKDLQSNCRNRGMSKFRAWYYFEGVDHFAKFAAKYGTEPKVIEVK